MEGIRKALDRAIQERSRQPDGADPADLDKTIDEEIPTIPTLRRARPRAAAADAAAGIVYQQTRTFTPSPALLESNRIMSPTSMDPGAAAFRMLRTQVLQRMDASGWRSLAIFSPAARDGKTTTAINLALSLASDLHHTALLVDFDFRKPSVATRLGLSVEFGADDILTGGAPVQDCLYHPEGLDRLVILPTRGSLQKSSEILAGPLSRALVAELRARYPDRIILYDLPPVLSADDALAFAPLVDCGLLVAAEGLTRRNDLVRTVELLHKTRLVGTVLNRASGASISY